MTELRVAILIASLLALSSCAPTLRQSVCFAAMPGVQVCQFSYDGDPQEAQ